MGSTMALTLDDGSVAERYEYQDFGEPEFFDGAGNPLAGSAVGNPYLFGGMQYDDESGLYLESSFEKGWPCRYEGPRDFDARIGRPIQRDGDGRPDVAVGGANALNVFLQR